MLAAGLGPAIWTRCVYDLIPRPDIYDSGGDDGERLRQHPSAWARCRDKMAIGLAKNCTSFAAFTRVDSVRLAVCEEHATGPMLNENIFARRHLPTTSTTTWALMASLCCLEQGPATDNILYSGFRPTNTLPCIRLIKFTSTAHAFLGQDVQAYWRITHQIEVAELDTKHYENQQKKVRGEQRSRQGGTDRYLRIKPPGL